MKAVKVCDTSWYWHQNLGLPYHLTTSESVWINLGRVYAMAVW